MTAYSDDKNSAIVTPHIETFVSKNRKSSQVHIGLISIFGSKNVGVRAISSSLRQAGVKVDTIFFKDLISSDTMFPTQREYDQLISLLRDLNVNFVGISLICSSLRFVAETVTARVRKDLGIPVIWGGPHASLLSEESLTYADMVCHGEGDQAIVDLVKTLENGQNTPTKNIWTKQDGNIIRNESYPLGDFESLPYPDFYKDHKYYINHGKIYESDPFHLSPDIYSMITSKGCQFHCTFCETNVFEESRGFRIGDNTNAEGLRFRKPGQIRQKSPIKVVNEIKHVLETGAKIKLIEFMDDEFSYNPEWVDEFTEVYKKEIRLPFWCQFHPHSVSTDIAKKLKSAGLLYVVMGLQTGSERVRNKVLGRPETDADFRKAIETVHSVNVIPKIDLIFDNPYEFEQDKKDAINYFLSLPKPFQFRIMSLCYFPGTKLTERALRDGHITEADVEGNSHKASLNFVMDINQTSVSELFWILLSPLTGCRFIPRALVRWMVGNKTFFEKHIKTLLALSHVVHFLGVVEKGYKIFFKGNITFSLFKTYFRYIFKVSS